MLTESLRVPYRADDAFGTIVVGSVLTVLIGALLAVWLGIVAVWPPVGLALTPVAALPSLVLRGYLLRVVDGGIRGESSLSSFVRWGSLFRSGVKSVFISVLYFLPGAVFCGLAVGGGTAAAISSSGFDETAQALTGVLILVSGVGMVGYGLVYFYVRPAARAVFAATGSVRAALGVRRVLRVAATGEYLTGWLVATGLLVAGPTFLLPVLVVAGAVGTVLPVVALLVVLVTLLGSVVLAFVLRVSAAWSTGRGAATGLKGVYPAAIEPVSATEDTGVGLEAQATPEVDGGSGEIDPLVQTGRTVEVTHTGATDGEPTTPEPEPNRGSEADDDRPADPRPVDHDAERVDHEDHQSADTDDSGSIDNEDGGFVWVDDENGSQ